MKHFLVLYASPLGFDWNTGGRFKYSPLPLENMNELKANISKIMQATNKQISYIFCSATIDNVVTAMQEKYEGVQFTSYGFKPLHEHLTFQGSDGKNDSVGLDALARMVKYGLSFDSKFILLTNCHS